jgi:hypothetical protein
MDKVVTAELLWPLVDINKPGYESEAAPGRLTGIQRSSWKSVWQTYMSKSDTPLTRFCLTYRLNKPEIGDNSLF